ncbi:MAG: YmdB family metallophosphoesterase [Treponema sp.]|jgi:calcineurin-like phosphoesterase|nr:YmdB family metallophosphoesterase [Treponema sp.]
MRILYVAELVGKAGIYALKKALNVLKTRFTWDFAIVCADGATGGNGLGRSHAAYINKLGANAITLGECCFYKKDLTENIEKIPFVLRPENLNPQAPGIGSKIFKTDEGKIAVVVLMGQNGFNRLHVNSPFTVLPDANQKYVPSISKKQHSQARQNIPSLLERLKKQTPYIIVDFHAQASAEKKTFFYAADGHCSAVIGSHTRVQTSDETILSGGTAVISDAGRTGSIQSVGGCEIKSRIQEYLTGIPDWTRDAWEAPELQGVYLELGKDGKALSIERIRHPVQMP